MSRISTPEGYINRQQFAYASPDRLAKLAERAKLDKSKPTIFEILDVCGRKDSYVCLHDFERELQAGLGELIDSLANDCREVINQSLVDKWQRINDCFLQEKSLQESGESWNPLMTLFCLNKNDKSQVEGRLKSLKNTRLALQKEHYNLKKQQGRVHDVIHGFINNPIPLGKINQKSCYIMKIIKRDPSLNRLLKFAFSTRQCESYVTNYMNTTGHVTVSTSPISSGV